MTDWISLQYARPKCCEDILFTDGRKVFSGWLETWDPDEDLVFYNSQSSLDHWPENITHWLPFPLPPNKGNT